MLKVSNLSVSYGKVNAVRDFSFHVGAGEIVTILGANGAGKSSTMNAIMGLAPVTRGTIEFEGEQISGTPVEAIVRKRLTLTPEGRQIFGDLTVRENLRLGGVTGIRSKIDATFEEMFKMFPILKERDSQLAGTLSGGEQQMLAIARSLMSHPKLLMLDEPSLGLAPLIIADVFELLSRLRARGVTILLVEQNVKQSLKLADRAYILETGELTISGTTEELRGSDEIVKRYLGGH